MTDIQLLGRLDERTEFLCDMAKEAKEWRELHTKQDDDRHEELTADIQDLKDTRLVGQTRERMVKWAAGSALALAGLPWIGKAFAAIGSALK